jgi:hypothetical protein
MQSSPLDLAPMLSHLPGQHGWRSATLARVHLLREPRQAILDLVEAKVPTGILMTSRGAVVAKGGRALGARPLGEALHH